MQRRHFLTALPLTVGLTGCTGRPATEAGTSSRTTDGAGAPDDDCSLPETTTVTTTSPTPTSSGTGQVSGGVSIRSWYDGTLSVVLVYDPEGAAVTTFARRYEDGRSPGDLGAKMIDWANYRVVIRADCEVIWNRIVYDYQVYELSVGEDGEVEVVGVAEA